eukprot:COSAG03_NODE_4791_length_1432_cov_8.265566_3_plen_106_part_01
MRFEGLSSQIRVAGSSKRQRALKLPRTCARIWPRPAGRHTQPPRRTVAASPTDGRIPAPYICRDVLTRFDGLSSQIRVAGSSERQRSTQPRKCEEECGVNKYSITP